MTPERIAEIQKRCEWATIAPWTVFTNDTEQSVMSAPLDRFVAHMNSNMHRYRDDAAFIAHARQDIPDLLDALAASQAELAAMRERAEALDKALLGLMLDVQLGNEDDIKRGLDQARQVRKETCPALAAAPPAPAADSRADAAPAEGA